MAKETSEIKQEVMLKVINAAIGYLKLVIAMLEELREGKDVKTV